MSPTTRPKSDGWLPGRRARAPLTPSPAAVSMTGTVPATPALATSTLNRSLREQDFWLVVLVDRVGAVMQPAVLADGIGRHAPCDRGDGGSTRLRDGERVEGAHFARCHAARYEKRPDSCDDAARYILAGLTCSPHPNDVTIEHLLAHTSGIGDYLEEDLGVDLDPTRCPARPAPGSDDALPAHPRWLPDELPRRGGARRLRRAFVVLAIIAERGSEGPFHVSSSACAAGGHDKTAYRRPDQLPGDAAFADLDVDGAAVYVFHLPVLAPATAGSTRRLPTWPCSGPVLHVGAIVPPDVVAAMTRPHAVGSARAVPPLRPRHLVAPDFRRRVRRRVRHRGVVTQRPRPDAEPDAHGDLQHGQRRLGRQPPPRPPPRHIVLLTIRVSRAVRAGHAGLARIPYSDATRYSDGSTQGGRNGRAIPPAACHRTGPSIVFMAWTSTARS